MGLRASDAIAILPFQVTPKKFAVAIYIVTPNIAQRLKPIPFIIEVDKAVKGDVAAIHCSTQTAGKAQVVSKAKGTTALAVEVGDDVTFLVFETE